MIRRRDFLTLAAAAVWPGRVRASDWVQDGEANGVPNLHRVTDQLWRSGQPKAKGFSFLADLGVQTVLSLRPSDRDDRRTDDPRLTLVSVPMKSRKCRA